MGATLLETFSLSGPFFQHFFGQSSGPEKNVSESKKNVEVKDINIFSETFFCLTAKTTSTGDFCFGLVLNSKNSATKSNSKVVKYPIEGQFNKLS